MKIALVTWFSAPNYGTFLQAFALQKYLISYNYNIEIINFKPNTFILNDFRSFIFKYFPFLGRILPYSYAKNLFNDYSNKFLLLSEKTTLKTIRRLMHHYDLFISGSDQIWNPDGKYKYFYMLDFCCKNEKCISYATSLGGKVIPESELSIYRRHLEKFKYISVRENNSRDTLVKLLDRNIDCLVDPVFLLSKKEWLLFSEDIILSEEYILCYFLGYQPYYLTIIEQLHLMYPKLKFIEINLGSKKKIDLPYITERTNVTPFQFLRLIDKSNFVCTDSYHATVFSIIFRKIFYHFVRFQNTEKSNQNYRVFDLLKRTKLEQFVISNENANAITSIDLFNSNAIDLLSSEVCSSKEILLHEIHSLLKDK